MEVPEDETDLFGEEPAGEETTPATEEESDLFDDSSLILPTTDLLSVRTWSDNTGTFQVEARLVQVLDGEVRLLKTTGKYTTVPNRRLSPSDLQFVRQSAATLA